MDWDAAVAAWRDIGVHTTAEKIEASWRQIRRWQKNFQKEAQPDGTVMNEGVYKEPRTSTHNTKEGKIEMNINEAFPSKFLKAADLQGRRITAKIADVALEKVGDDQKPVCHFEGRVKPLVLNKTNSMIIAEITGSAQTEKWIGCEVVLYSARVDFQGRRVDSVRVDHVPVKSSAASGADIVSDEIPF